MEELDPGHDSSLVESPGDDQGIHFLEQGRPQRMERDGGNAFGPSFAPLIGFGHGPAEVFPTLR